MFGFHPKRNRSPNRLLFCMPHTHGCPPTLSFFFRLLHIYARSLSYPPVGFGTLCAPHRSPMSLVQCCSLHFFLHTPPWPPTPARAHAVRGAFIDMISPPGLARSSVDAPQLPQPVKEGRMAGLCASYRTA
eukprot:EG_transcript_20142